MLSNRVRGGARRSRRTPLAFLALLSLIRGLAVAQTPLADPLPDLPDDGTVVRLDLLADGLVFPTDVFPVPDGSGRRFVTGADGRVWIVTGSGAVLMAPFADLRQSPPFSNNGTALAGLAFHPEFAQDEAAGLGGRLYVAVQEAPGSGTPDWGPVGGVQESVLIELRADPDAPDREDTTARREVLRISEFHTIHNLNDLAFGPDGYLYLAKGDDLLGGQDLTQVGGKVLRIDVDFRPGNPLAANGSYALPADNPFVGSPAGLDEIYAYGFRNPWQMSFDPPTGALWVADVGEHHVEEVNRVELAPDGRAQNYGWDFMEGSFAFLDPGVSDDLSGLPLGFVGVDPVGQYDHDQDHRSITGGVVYRGVEVPHLVGDYVFGDWMTGALFRLDTQTGAIARLQLDPASEVIHGWPPTVASPPFDGIIAVRADADGEVLVVVTQRDSTPTGRILRSRLVACPVENRCQATPNSTGFPALMELEGSASVAANDMRLVARPMQPASPGLFYYGNEELELPFGDGYRCIGGTLVRVVPAAFANVNGTLRVAFDNSLPQHALIEPGLTLSFQAWYRDPQAGQSGFNLSDALRVTVCP